MEEEYSSRIHWLISLNRPIPDLDERSLDSIRKEFAFRDDLAQARADFLKRNKWLSLYPDSGPYARELYIQHLEFYRNGATFDERLLMGSNRSGKTVCGAYETVCHCTGVYPYWWEGFRFIVPIEAWVINKGAKEVRDVNEAELLGPIGNVSARGNGMIPAHRLMKTTPKSGTPNGTEFIFIKHVSGGTSVIQSKSFDQGREAFQGTAKHWIWADEECPESVYGECHMRTMKTSTFEGGRIALTYTPILGLTPLTTEFMREAGIELEPPPREEIVA